MYYVNKQNPALVQSFPVPSDLENWYAMTTPPPFEFYKIEGGQYVEDEEAKSAALDALRRELIAKIDEAAAEAYAPLTRFLPEYELREAQAKEFAERGFSGSPPAQIAAFAEPTGKTPEEAAKIVLQQAAHLRGLLDALGKARMRKFEIQAALTLEEAMQKAEDIIRQIETAARGG